MKTLFALFIASAVSLVLVQAEDKTVSEKSSEAWDKTKEKSSEAWDKTKKKTKEVGQAVVDKTKEAAAAVEAAVTKPDEDARKVAVKVDERRIQMPKSLAAGKTAFVVTNVGKEKHNFEIQGETLEKSFYLSLAPKDEKVMQVDLKPGTYKVYCPLKEHEGKGTKMEVTVK